MKTKSANLKNSLRLNKAMLANAAASSFEEISNPEELDASKTFGLNSYYIYLSKGKDAAKAMASIGEEKALELFHIGFTQGAFFAHGADFTVPAEKQALRTMERNFDDKNEQSLINYAQTQGNQFARNYFKSHPV